MAAALNPGIGPIWPISVETYHEMAEKGILHSGDPVELLEGIIVQKPVKGPPHVFSNRAARLALERMIPAGWFVRVQDPITLATSEPEPDIAVIRGDPRDYLKRHPGPDEIGLVMEIADSSLERDSILKKRVYAAAGISYYWLLNLKARWLEVYSVPQGNEYTRREIHRPEQTVDVVLDGKIVGAVRVVDLLPE
jgi:Uma2 family endonuclease